MRKILIPVSALVLAACGSGGGTSFRNPDTVQFDYASGSTAPSGATGAQAAAEAGMDAVGSLTAGSSSTDAQDLFSVANDVPAALGLVNPLFDEGSALRQTRDALQRARAALVSGEAVDPGAGFDDPSCVTLTETQVRFDRCVSTGIIGSLSIDGAVTRGLTRVYWDVSVRLEIHGDSGGNLAAGTHATGDLTVSETAFTGFVRNDNSASASGGGQSVSLAYTDNVDYDLVLDPGQSYCVTDGTIELKHLWSERPAGYPAGQLPDVGVLFDWNACGSVTVTWATH
jgi:hypothetical protein